MLYKPVRTQNHAVVGVFRQRGFLQQNPAETAAELTEYKIVLHELAESLLAEQRKRDKGAGQNVALHGNR